MRVLVTTWATLDAVTRRQPSAWISRASPKLHVAGQGRGTREIVVWCAQRLDELQRERRRRRGAARAAHDAAMTMTRSKDPLLEEARVLGLASLIAQVQTMIEESGDSEGFDAAKWLGRWLDRPLPALGGQKPMELMDTPDGRALVHSIVARMQTGALS